MELDVSSDLKEQVDILTSLVGSDRMDVGYILPYLRTAGRLFEDKLRSSIIGNRNIYLQ